MFDTDLAQKNVSLYLSGLFIKVVRAKETFIFYFPTRNEESTDDAGKRFECYQQDHYNLHRENPVSDRSQVS